MTAVDLAEPAMVTLVSRLGRVVATPARRGGGEDSDDDSTTSDTIPFGFPKQST